MECEKLDVNIEKKFVTKSPHPNRKIDYMMQIFNWNEWDHWDEWTDDNNDTFVEMSPLYLDAEDENTEIVKILLQDKNLDINSVSKFSFENQKGKKNMKNGVLKLMKKKGLFAWSYL